MAVSLHATTDEVRDWIVPVNRREGLQVRAGGPCGLVGPPAWVTARLPAGALSGPGCPALRRPLCPAPAACCRLARSRLSLAHTRHTTCTHTQPPRPPHRTGAQALIECMEELFPKSSAAPRHGHHVLIEYIMLR